MGFSRTSVCRLSHLCRRNVPETPTSHSHVRPVVCTLVYSLYLHFRYHLPDGPGRKRENAVGSIDLRHRDSAIMHASEDIGVNPPYIWQAGGIHMPSHC